MNIWDEFTANVCSTHQHILSIYREDFGRYGKIKKASDFEYKNDF